MTFPARHKTADAFSDGLSPISPVRGHGRRSLLDSALAQQESAVNRLDSLFSRRLLALHWPIRLTVFSRAVKPGSPPLSSSTTSASARTPALDRSLFFLSPFFPFLSVPLSLHPLSNRSHSNICFLSPVPSQASCTSIAYSTLPKPSHWRQNSSKFIRRARQYTQVGEGGIPGSQRQRQRQWGRSRFSERRWRGGAGRIVCDAGGGVSFALFA